MTTSSIISCIFRIPSRQGRTHCTFLLTILIVLAIFNSTAKQGEDEARVSEPDPSHTLEERVVHWYFTQLDSNRSNDINKREMKPLKRYVKRKAKPKKCARRFTDFCDLNKDKSISLQELKGCLGVIKEAGDTHL